MPFGRAREERPTPKEVYNYRVYWLASLACLGSWVFGYNNGVIPGVLVLPAFYEDFQLPPVGSSSYNTITSNIVALVQIGGLAGSVGTFPLMKFWGRKIALSVAAGVFTIGAALQTFAYGKLSIMYAGRFLAGLGAGSATVIVPLYISELSPPAIRGSLIGFYEINNQLSSLTAYWCNYAVSEYIPSTQARQWQIPLGLQLIFSILLFFAAIFILPESPRFLILNGSTLKARYVLSYVRRLSVEHEYINAEMAEIEEAIERQQRSGPQRSAGKFGLFRELFWKGNRNRVMIGLGLMIGQNITGIAGMNFYTPTIFRTIGFDGTKVVLIASGMYALVKSLVAIFSLTLFVDRLGRKKLLLGSSIGITLSMWYIGAFITATNLDPSVSHARSAWGWVAIICVYIFAGSFGFAWNGVPWIYCAEIFPTRIKELAVCITTATQWLVGFAVARASPAMISGWRGGFFFFFAGCSTVMGVLIWVGLPETKGRSLERMDELFGTAYGIGGGDEGVVVGGDDGKKGIEGMEMQDVMVSQVGKAVV
ncbi:general substrate transporter [Bisporella sp. PMI_857]|nr:general substrate transporter [Bisporella sp. PMI_857]